MSYRAHQDVGQEDAHEHQLAHHHRLPEAVPGVTLTLLERRPHEDWLGAPDLRPTVVLSVEDDVMSLTAQQARTVAAQLPSAADTLDRRGE